MRYEIHDISCLGQYIEKIQGILDWNYKTAGFPLRKMRKPVYFLLKMIRFLISFGHNFSYVSFPILPIGLLIALPAILVSFLLLTKILVSYVTSRVDKIFLSTALLIYISIVLAPIRNGFSLSSIIVSIVIFVCFCVDIYLIVLALLTPFPLRFRYERLVNFKNNRLHEKFNKAFDDFFRLLLLMPHRERVVLSADKFMLPKKSCVLLRSFQDDYTFVSELTSFYKIFTGKNNERLIQSVISRKLSAEGKVFAIHDPCDPELEYTEILESEHRGIYDISAGTLDWKSLVKSYLSDSQRIIVFLGETEGLCWEYSQISQMDLLDKVLLVFPPLSHEMVQSRWRIFCRSTDLMDLYDTVELFANSKHPILMNWDRNKVQFVVSRLQDYSTYSYAFDLALQRAYL